MAKDQYYANNNVAEEVVTIDPATGVAAYDGGGLNTTAVAAGTITDTVIKASAGRLARVLVTASGTAALNIYDNATTHSGTIICAIPASAPVGSIYDLRMPATNGITVGGALNTPGITASWS